MQHAGPGRGAVNDRPHGSHTHTHSCCLCLCLSTYTRPVSLGLQQHQLLLSRLNLGTSLQQTEPANTHVAACGCMLCTQSPTHKVLPCHGT